MKEKTSPFDFAEQRAMLSKHMAGIASYWCQTALSQGQPDTISYRIDGAGHSILAAIDGCGIAICSLAVASRMEQGCEEAAGFEGGLADEVLGRLEIASARALCEQFASLEGWVPAGGENFGEDLILGAMRLSEGRWSMRHDSGECCRMEALSGFVGSMACVLEGFAPQIGFALRSRPAEEDKQWHIDRGERWHPPLGGDDPVEICDCAGSLRYAWSRRWGRGSDGAMSLEARCVAAAQAKELELSIPLGKESKAKML